MADMFPFKMPTDPETGTEQTVPHIPKKPKESAEISRHILTLAPADLAHRPAYIQELIEYEKQRLHLDPELAGVDVDMYGAYIIGLQRLLEGIAQMSDNIMVREYVAIDLYPMMSADGKTQIAPFPQVYVRAAVSLSNASTVVIGGIYKSEFHTTLECLGRMLVGQANIWPISQSRGLPLSRHVIETEKLDNGTVKTKPVNPPAKANAVFNGIALMHDVLRTQIRKHDSLQERDRKRKLMRQGIFEKLKGRLNPDAPNTTVKLNRITLLLWILTRMAPIYDATLASLWNMATMKDQNIPDEVLHPNPSVLAWSRPLETTHRTITSITRTQLMNPYKPPHSIHELRNTTETSQRIVTEKPKHAPNPVRQPPAQLFKISHEKRKADEDDASVPDSPNKPFKKARGATIGMRVFDLPAM